MTAALIHHHSAVAMRSTDETPRFIPEKLLGLFERSNWPAASLDTPETNVAQYCATAHLCFAYPQSAKRATGIFIVEGAYERV